MSLEALIAARTPVHWVEAVAIVERACGALVNEDGVESPAPNSSGIAIESNGSIVVVAGDRTGLSANRLGRMLHSLASAERMPVPLRLLVTKWIETAEEHSIAEMKQELARYLDSDGETLIRAVYERWETSQGRPRRPTAVATREVDTDVSAEDPPVARPQPRSEQPSILSRALGLTSLLASKKASGARTQRKPSVSQAPETFVPEAQPVEQPEQQPVVTQEAQPAVVQHEAERAAQQEAALVAQREAALAAQREAEVAVQREAERAAQREAALVAQRKAALAAQREAQVAVQREVERAAQREAALVAQREAALAAQREAEPIARAAMPPVTPRSARPIESRATDSLSLFDAEPAGDAFFKPVPIERARAIFEPMRPEQQPQPIAPKFIMRGLPAPKVSRGAALAAGALAVLGGTVWLMSADDSSQPPAAVVATATPPIPLDPSSERPAQRDLLAPARARVRPSPLRLDARSATVAPVARPSALGLSRRPPESQAPPADAPSSRTASVPAAPSLSGLAAALPEAESTPTPVSARRDEARVYTSEDLDVQPPIMVFPQRPSAVPWTESDFNTMEIVVSESGTVEHVRLLTAPKRMTDMLLLSGAKNWRFEPATVDGAAVRYRLAITWPTTR